MVGDQPSEKKAEVKAFNDEFKKIGEGFTPEAFTSEVAACVTVGSKFSSLDGILKASNEEKLDLAHEEGKVFLVDFWATWCGPCQKPMKHNCEVMEKHKEDWADKVRMIAVSINDPAATLMKFLQNRGFDNVEHYVAGDSACSDIYGVTGVPHVCLVDKKGIIQFIGHPMDFKLEEDIQTLLDDKPLSYGGGEDPAKSSDTGDIDPEKVKAENEKVMKAFEEKKDELKAASQGLYQAAIVYVCEETICCVANKSCFKLSCVMAAIGPAENVEKAKESMKDFTNHVGELYVKTEQFMPF